MITDGDDDVNNIQHALLNLKEIPGKFDFPFTPYTIQHEFMRNLYETIEKGKLGIFESPTGTGKSLSIICGALRWLKDHNAHERDKLQDEIERLETEKIKLAKDPGDWLDSQSKEIVIVQKLNLLKIEQNKIVEYDKKIEKLFNKKTLKPKKAWDAFSRNNTSKVDDDIEKNVEEDEENEEEILLEDKIPQIEEESSDEEEENKYEPVKILICSRTHSQLSQLVGEINKSPFGKSARAVSLASRQNYCINPAVSKLKNVTLINERCLDMQNKSKKVITKTDGDGKTLKRQKGSSCQCPFNKQQSIENLRDASLLEIHDVEDLVMQGKQLNACPYYASRKAAEDAQIVLIPYNTLLHKRTREATGIKLKNNVVIIDEAHNLLEALAQMYSADINCVQLEEARQRLSGYKQKYSKRLSSQNLLTINQLLFVISRLINALSKNVDIKENETKTEIYTVESFVLAAEIDNYNMFKLIKFCRDTRIAQKIHAFSNKFPEDILNKTIEKPKNQTGIKGFLSSIENKNNVTQQSETNENVAKSPIMLGGNPFLVLISLLEALTCSYEDGRIIIHKNLDKKQRRLQFLLLNPAEQFKDIVKEARSVIVAGGTMKPISEFRERLFVSAGATSERIVEFSCDHIIPARNILPLAITKGFNQENLLFNLENRFTMGSSLKQILQEVSKVVKGGIVVFFPSYKYESWVWQQLHGTDFGRPVFREPQDSTSVDTILNSFASAIQKSKSVGAMLFSVVGGKLSEGLNFSDDLGRCVIVVGLPYANINSPELKEKMRYLDKTEGKGAGQQFYEATCMKAVNQCIGRAVRHRNDYACVLLLDMRYDRVTTKNALPDWIKRSLSTANFNQALSLIKKFFQEHALVK